MLVWNRFASLYSRMAAFQSCDKMDNLDQKYCHMTKFQRKNGEFQKLWENNYNAYFFCAVLFYLFYVLQ